MGGIPLALPWGWGRFLRAAGGITADMYYVDHRRRGQGHAGGNHVMVGLDVFYTALLRVFLSVSFWRWASRGTRIKTILTIAVFR
jgi:hypothetical protein